MSEPVKTAPEAEAEGEDVFAMFACDIDSAEEGKWFDVGKMRLKVRRFDSKKSRKVRDRLEAPHKATRRLGSLPEHIIDEITTQHLAEGILVDWKGVLGKDKKPIPFSKEAAMALFTKIPDFRSTVANLSLEVNNYREQEQEEVEKNS